MRFRINARIINFSTNDMKNYIHYKYDDFSKEPWGDPLEMHLFNKNEIYRVYNSKMYCS